VVLDGGSADYFLVSARDSGQVGDRTGISLFVVPRDAPGVTVAAYPTQWGARAADLLLENVSVGADALIGDASHALPVIERAVDGAIAALCAEAVGVIQALNETTLNYLKTRKQFGVAIGTFQALKHKMADMLIAAEQSRSMAIIAAVHADSSDAAARRRAVSAAKAYLGQAARLVGQNAVQMHGGMGVVDEHIVSHYFKRLTMIDLTFGDADYHLAKFSDSLLPAA
jgi:alkylation response protein AidB-like acyl-CoA dehydrogenase